jgi:hypothetical protein
MSADNPLDVVLRDLAAGDDDLVAAWAQKLLTGGERSGSETPAAAPSKPPRRHRPAVGRPRGSP